MAGKIYAMAGVELEHIDVVRNLIVSLEAQFGGRPCKTYFNDMRVRSERGDLYTYLDVAALCGELRFDRSSRPPSC